MLSLTAALTSPLTTVDCVPNPWPKNNDFGLSVVAWIALGTDVVRSPTRGDPDAARVATPTAARARHTASAATAATTRPRPRHGRKARTAVRPSATHAPLELVSASAASITTIAMLRTRGCSAAPQPAARMARPRKRPRLFGLLSV